MSNTPDMRDLFAALMSQGAQNSGSLCGCGTCLDAAKLVCADVAKTVLQDCPLWALQVHTVGVYATGIALMFQGLSARENGQIQIATVAELQTIPEFTDMVIAVVQSVVTRNEQRDMTDDEKAIVKELMEKTNVGR